MQISPESSTNKHKSQCQSLQVITQLNRHHFISRRNRGLKDVEILLKEIFASEESCYVDPHYLTTIKSCLLYQPNFTLNAAATIIKERPNTLELYWAFIWLAISLKQQKSRTYSLDVQRTGIVPYLFQFVTLDQHPFLQLRAICILLAIYQPLLHSEKHHFFDDISISYEKWKQIIETSDPCIVKKSIEMLRHIIMTSEFKSKKEDLSFLNLLKVLAYNSNQNYLDLVFQTFTRFSPQNLGSDLNFQRNLCYFIIQLLDLLNTKSIKVESMNKFINWVKEPILVQRGCRNVWKGTSQELLYLPRLFKKLHDFDLKSSFFSVKLWCVLVKEIVKARTRIMFQWNTLTKIQDRLGDTCCTGQNRNELLKLYWTLLELSQKENAVCQWFSPKIMKLLSQSISITTNPEQFQYLQNTFFSIFTAIVPYQILPSILQFDLLKNFIQTVHKPLFENVRQIFLVKLLSLLDEIKQKEMLGSQYNKIGTYLLEEGLLELIINSSLTLAQSYLRIKKELEQSKKGVIEEYDL